MTISSKLVTPKLSAVVVSFCIMVNCTLAPADERSLKSYGAPNSFSDASAEALGALEMKSAYASVVGDKGEQNEVWVLESKRGFEEACESVFSWLHKNKFKLIDAECYSQSNQYCEIRACREDGGGISFEVADQGKAKRSIFALIRLSGPEKSPDPASSNSCSLFGR